MHRFLKRICSNSARHTFQVGKKCPPGAADECAKCLEQQEIPFGISDARCRHVHDEIRSGNNGCSAPESHKHQHPTYKILLKPNEQPTRPNSLSTYKYGKSREPASDWLLFFSARSRRYDIRPALGDVVEDIFRNSQVLDDQFGRRMSYPLGQ